MTAITSITRKRATRYVVRSTTGDNRPRIVMAPTSAAAIAHVAASMLVAAPITLDEMEELASQGIRTEYPRRDDDPEAEPASAPPAPPVDAATAAMLAQIAMSPIDKLPPMITKMAQKDDGNPVLGEDGLPILLNQDGSPLTVIQQAIVARSRQLRAQSGG